MSKSGVYTNKKNSIIYHSVSDKFVTGL